ncbi:MAG TPA: universal stress protein [Terracidiphilus sp.]
MQVFQSVAIVPEPTLRPVSAKTLRQWCAPEVILVVTNLTDELVILPHVIMQAKPSRGRIILTHMVTPIARSGNAICRTRRPASGVEEARTVLERMARHLRWLGFVCEPLVLTGLPEIEIPSIARSCGVDRVIVGFEHDPNRAGAGNPTALAQLLPELDPPACVIGSHVSLASGNSFLTKRITLAASLASDCDVPLSFACRLAQEQRAKLTVVHVFGRGSGDENSWARTPLEIASRLPVPAWREAELLCPTEITIREGDAADEILKHSLSTNPDLIILCSPGNLGVGQCWRESVSYRVIAGAQCPVFVLKKQPEAARLRDDMFSEKVPAYGESPTLATRKEDFM